MRSDAEVTDIIIDGGLAGTMLEAAVHAVRCGDFGYLQSQYRKLVLPLLTVSSPESHWVEEVR